MKIKKIIFINRTDSGSTGTIVTSLFNNASNFGFSSYLIASKIYNPGERKIEIDTNKFLQFCNKILTKISGKDGFLNFYNTKKIIKNFKKIKPDIVNLHNALGYFINYPMLLKYLHKSGIKTYITCHDCWWFTGKCPHFEYVGCSKWKTECYKCPQNKMYPKALIFDRTRKMFSIKKKLFTNKKFTFIFPSQWLLNYAKESFLKNEKMVRINNGIILGNYMKHSCDKNESSKVKLIFIANPWTKRKGIDTIRFLANNLPEDQFELFVVGIISEEYKISKNNVHYCGLMKREEIIKLFTNKTIFVNPTLEDNFPTVDIESLAAGVPVISFDTGGTKEILGEFGVIVEKGSDIKMLEAIVHYQFDEMASEKMRERSLLFEETKMINKYYQTFTESLDK